MVETTKDNKEIILDIISEAFKHVKNAYDLSNEPNSSKDSRLIFPKKRDESIRVSEPNIRVSEQELRFAFVEEFLKYVKKKKKDWYYAVEVPTKIKYDFSDKKNPKVAEEGKGKSASFDLAIYAKGDNNFNLIALLEFKAGNPKKFDYHKDLVKLENEKEGDNEVLRFFIEIVKNADERTPKNIESKLKDKRQQTNFICYSLTEGEKVLELTQSENK
nr:hypothetical protein [uncultured Prevotella sp.]